MARLTIPYRREIDAMSLSKLIADWDVYLRNANYSPRTVETYVRAGQQFVAFLTEVLRRADDVREYTDDAMQAFAAHLRTLGIRPATTVVRLVALSNLAKYGMSRTAERGRNKRLIEHDPTQSFRWPQVDQAETHFLYPDELKALLALDLPAWKALARDLTLETGLRASELCRANVGDLREVNGAHYLAVIVKGRRRRERSTQVPVSPGLAAFIWRTLFADKRVNDADPLLVNAHGQRMTRTNLSTVLDRIGQEAGIERFHVSAHKLRHTMNVIARVSGVDSAQRSRLLGHTSPSSLARYDHVVPGELHDARARQLEGMDRYLGGFGHAAQSEAARQKPPEESG